MAIVLEQYLVMEEYHTRFELRRDLVNKILPVHITENLHSMDVHLEEEYDPENFEKMKRLFMTLNKKLEIERQHQLGAIFLEKYLREKLTPRGLWVNLSRPFY